MKYGLLGGLLLAVLGTAVYSQWNPPPTGCSTLYARCDGQWGILSASAAWGTITGTLSAQTDLQTALDGKSSTAHQHAQTDITNLTADLAAKSSTSHTHSGLPATAVLTADRTNATTSYANITDLAFNVSANTRYKVTCTFQYNANATTTGIGVGWTGPASPTFTTGQFRAPLTAATIGGTVSVGNDTGGVTTASAATTNNAATFSGIWANGANAGTLQMRFKSEVAVANAIIIKAGSMCQIESY